MMKRNNVFLVIFFTICSVSAFAQMKNCNYRRKITNIQQEWQHINLPNSIFGKANDTLSDLRIYGITAKNDTVEAPYLLHMAADKVSEKDVHFNLLNESQNEKGYFFTFEIPIETAINKLKLDIEQVNFDWKIQLEGSQNQREWFSIVDNYRILSIQNENTKFRFCDIDFPNSKYHYYRLLIKSKEKPILKSTIISKIETVSGILKKYSANYTRKESDKKTILSVSLPEYAPITQVNVFIKDKFDYYRPINIECPTDSVKLTNSKSSNDWIYHYKTLQAGMLNSDKSNELKFESTILKKLTISIENDDNKPLQIDSVQVAGYTYRITARFTDPATYYLCYGNEHAETPKYDIEHFEEKITDTTAVTTLEKEEVLHTASTTEPLFTNKLWLWLVMTVMIVLLGWFSLKMVKEKAKTSEI